MLLNHNSSWDKVSVLLSLLQDRGQLEGFHLHYFDGEFGLPTLKGLFAESSAVLELQPNPTGALVRVC
jgi:hypothetical protein